MHLWNEDCWCIFFSRNCLLLVEINCHDEKLCPEGGLCKARTRMLQWHDLFVLSIEVQRMYAWYLLLYGRIRIHMSIFLWVCYCIDIQGKLPDGSVVGHKTNGAVIPGFFMMRPGTVIRVLSDPRSQRWLVTYPFRSVGRVRKCLPFLHARVLTNNTKSYKRRYDWRQCETARLSCLPACTDNWSAGCNEDHGLCASLDMIQ